MGNILSTAFSVTINFWRTMAGGPVDTVHQAGTLNIDVDLANISGEPPYQIPRHSTHTTRAAGEVINSTPPPAVAPLDQSAETNSRRVADINGGVGDPGDEVPIQFSQFCLIASEAQDRYTLHGDLHDIQMAIDNYRGALHVISEGHPWRPPVMSNLANCLINQYQQLGETQDLEDAVRYHEEILLLRPPGHPARSSTLNSLAVCLQAQYAQQGRITYLEQAIHYLREVVRLCPQGHPDRSRSLSNLSGCLQTKYGQLGAIEHLQESAQCLRDAVQLCPSGHPYRPSMLSNLANCLRTQYVHQGGLHILEEAIQCSREAMLLHPLEHPGRATSLFTLAGCLQIRYEQNGAIQDLEEAVQYLRKALQLQALGHPNQISTFHNLAHCLVLQYRHQGRFHDLEEAIHYYKEALLYRPPGHPKRSSTLNNLACCLVFRYKEQGGTQDIGNAVQHYREALFLCPSGHPYRSMSLNNLAACLREQHDLDGNIGNVVEAIQCFKEAVLLRPLGHPERPSTLYNLAGCLETRYKKNGILQDLEDAVQYLHESMQVCPANHPLLVLIWTHLASAYADNSEVLRGFYPVQEYPRLFEKAANHPTGSLKDRFQASLSWIKRQSGPSGLHAYQKCLELADHYLLIRPYITSRHQLLLSIPQTLASDAAASAIEAGDIKKAVEFLEQGRTLIWSQMGRYRTPLDALNEAHPNLAAEFTMLSKQLELSATSGLATELPQQSVEDEARMYRQRADSWNTVVDQIRRLDGFGNFLQVPKFSSLQLASNNGPVIILNISSRHSDAIIVQKTGDPPLVPLPEAQLNHISSLSSDFAQAIQSIREGKAGKDNKSGRSKVLIILQSLWDDIVQLVVTKLQEIDVPPGSRIWWCPTSELAMLPLHAAGLYRRKKQYLANLYISSYTPTLSALIRSSQYSTSGAGSLFNPSHLLVIAQPNVGGQQEIPGVRAELDKIMEVTPAIDLLLDENGTHSAVMVGLKTHCYVHFASHGSQCLESPFKSCFYLHDKPLTLLDIIEARLPDAQFAFLSACHSAAGDRSRPDETIHLAAALQFSGFRSVIGTMYAMADVDGPTVAEEVYKHMFRRIGVERPKSGQLTMDYRDAAEALHIATKVLRENGAPVERWINFVHIGA